MAAAHQALEREIGAPAQDQERRLGVERLRLGRLGRGHDAVQLPCVSARELHADDVRVRGELDDDIRGEIQAGDSAGVVVDQERDG